MAAFDLADWLCPDAPNGRQPQGAYAINDDHPLARSLIYALHGGEVGRTSMASIMQRSIGPFGAQIGVSSASYSGDPVVVKDIKSAQCAGLSEYSIFVIFSRVSGPTAAPTIFAETTSGGYGRNMFYYNSGWVWRTRDNTSGDTGSPDELSVVSPVSGAYQKRLFTYGKGSKKAYLNGVLSNSKSLTTSGFTSTDSVGFAVNGALDNSNTSYGGDSKVALLYMFNRVLTADEARLLSNDPYALLGSPLKSVFLGAAAGGGSTLTIAKPFHGHSIQGATLGATSADNLAVQDGGHSQALDAITLTAQDLLATADTIHSQAVENISLGVTGADSLSLSPMLHGHVLDAAPLTVQWLLLVAEAIHSHLAEQAALDTSNATTLSAQAAGHSHGLDGVGLSLQTWLSIVEVAHGQLADSAALSASIALQIAEALHAHYADTVVLSFPGVMSLTPADISAIAQAVLAATAGSRTVGQHLQAQSAVLLGAESGAGTGHISYADGSAVVEADVPLPGVVGNRTNVMVTGV